MDRDLPDRRRNDLGVELPPRTGSGPRWHPPISAGRIARPTTLPDGGCAIIEPYATGVQPPSSGSEPSRWVAAMTVSSGGLAGTIAGMVEG